MPDIEAFFASRGFRLQPTAEGPPSRSSDELRRMPSRLQAAYRDIEEHPPAIWMNLCRLDGTTVHPWYGAGESREQALRSAARRWRIEQEPAD